MEWINFDKQVPEEDQRCVVFTEEKRYIVATYGEEEGMFFEPEFGDEILDVIAWTPLYQCTV